MFSFLPLLSLLYLVYTCNVGSRVWAQYPSSGTYLSAYIIQDVDTQRFEVQWDRDPTLCDSSGSSQTLCQVDKALARNGDGVTCDRFYNNYQGNNIPTDGGPQIQPDVDDKGISGIALVFIIGGSLVAVSILTGIAYTSARSNLRVRPQLKEDTYHQVEAPRRSVSIGTFITSSATSFEELSSSDFGTKVGDIEEPISPRDLELPTGPRPTGSVSTSGSHAHPTRSPSGQSITSLNDRQQQQQHRRPSHGRAVVPQTYRGLLDEQPEHLARRVSRVGTGVGQMGEVLFERLNLFYIMSVPGLPTSVDLSKEITSGPANAYTQSDHFDNKVPMQLPINNKRVPRPLGMQLPPPSATPPCFAPSLPVSSPVGGSPLAPLAPGVTMDWQTLMGNLRGRARCASSSPMSSSLASSPYASTSVPSPTPCLPEPSHQFPPGDFPMDPAAYGYQNGPGFSKWSIYREAALRQEEMARIQWERQFQEGVRQRLHSGFNNPGSCWSGEQFHTAGAPSAQYAKSPGQDPFGAAVAAAAMAIMEGRYEQQQQQQQMSSGLLPSREAYHSRMPSPVYGPGYYDIPPPQQQRSGLPLYIEEMIRSQIEQQIRECIQQQVCRMMEQWRDNSPMYYANQRPPTAPPSSAWDADQAIFNAAVAAATKAVNESRGTEGSQMASSSEQFRGLPRVGSPPPPLLAPMPSRATAKREPGTNSFVESMNHQQPLNKNDAAHPADGVRLAPYVPPVDEESTPPVDNDSS
ncbi:hypothetical protein FOL47_000081 [Perkinsus chesapeaki]|uniref:Uncharacterized protein n=1 Tax=Perkinsus chesapeaki TaxID=330153 RepID=A0A7J6N346_PERCH|nr:hypothetical protein FOL47_000081 [Perkinsus chesapeaki]